MAQSPDFDPPANAFSHRFVVPQSDIDALGHAGNVAWLRWVNDAASAHSQSVGLDLDGYRALGVLWVVRRHEIDYLAEARAGQALEALTWVSNVRGASSLRRTLVRRQGGGANLCRAITTWVMINVTSGKPTRIPKEILARYGFAKIESTVEVVD